MPDNPAAREITLRIIARPDEGCWDVRCTIDHVVMHSRRVVTVNALTRLDAKYLFSAVEQEIDSWIW